MNYFLKETDEQRHFTLHHNHLSIKTLTQNFQVENITKPLLK